jgi:hypothetical protein
VRILGTWRIAIRTSESMGPFGISKPDSVRYSVSGRVRVLCFFLVLFCISES